jgi:peptide/nickel transport system ATP-binding protein
MPDPSELPSGCRFHPRCPKAMDRCSVVFPERTMLNTSHYVSCHLYDESPEKGEVIREKETIRS